MNMLAPAIPPLFTRRYSGAQGIGSNQTAVINVPCSGRHYESRMEFKTSAGANLTQAQIESQVTEIRVKLNGQDILEATPAFLHMLQKYYGDHKNADVVPGVIVIDWARRNLNLPGERKQYALGMADVKTFTIEIKLGTLTNLSSIDMYATVSNESSNLGPHVRLTKLSRSFSGTGDLVDSNLPVVANQGLIAAHIGLGAGTMSNVSLLADDTYLLDRVTPTVQQQILEHNKRNPQTGYYHIDFNGQDEALGFLPMAPGGRELKDFRLTTNWSVAPSNFAIYLERVYNLPTG